MAINYDKTQWINNETPVNAQNLNKHEDALEFLYHVAKDIPNEEEIRISNELARVNSENSRVEAENKRVSDSDKKITELSVARTQLETNVTDKLNQSESKVNAKLNEADNKIIDVEKRFQTIIASQQQDSEVIDARDGEISLNARLQRDLEKGSSIVIPIEGGYISTESNGGYVQNLEVHGNTYQDPSDLANIKSVGDEVKGHGVYEIPLLSVGKNLARGFDRLSKTDRIQFDLVINEIGDYTMSFDYSGLLNANTVSIGSNNIGYMRVNNKKVIFNFTITDANLLDLKLGNKMYVYRSERDFVDPVNLMVEEGTVATSYQDYVSDKLTILSPCQLEKVGTVADRIIEKDGVWGVEKNVLDYVDLNKISFTMSTPGDFRATLNLNVLYSSNKLNCISSIYLSRIPDSPMSDKTITIYKHGDGRFELIISDSSISNLNDFTNKIKDSVFKVAITTPTFIPLPHDQQIKLRTFASKTNISFLSEIEGTVKGEVAKSLGATVNTHTLEIDNLHQELDRVKKLEESTVSTVSNDGKDFVSVEATNSGYFEDVVVQGATRVNKLYRFNDVKWKKTGTGHVVSNEGKTLTINANAWGCGYYTDITLPSGKYVSTIKNLNSGRFKIANLTTSSDISITTSSSICFELNSESVIRFYIENITQTGTFIFEEPMLLDGSNMPSSYFEGLASVGEGTDEIVVSSVTNNLVDASNYIKGTLDGKFVPDGNVVFSENTVTMNTTVNAMLSYRVPSIEGKLSMITNLPNITCYIYDGATQIKSIFSNTTISNRLVVNFDTRGFKEPIIALYRGTGAPNVLTFSDVKISIDSIVYTEHKTDEKRILRLNTETNTWEKPVLREWDIVKKDSNGKYWNIERSKQVVLNGSENWSSYLDLGNVARAFITLENSVGGTMNSNGISDKFKITSNVDLNEECFWVNTLNNRLGINISKSKLTTQDIAGFKAWLQANPVTVVYQLATEKVYECTNLDLISYPSETLLTVKSGVLVPNITASYNGTIMNVVTELQRKVSVLESNVKETQAVQDMVILESDMRILDLELALMEYVPMQINLRGSDTMFRSATYFNFLKGHIENETYSKEYLENVMNKYLATNRIDQTEYDELYKMLYPPVYDIPTELI